MPSPTLPRAVSLTLTSYYVEMGTNVVDWLLLAERTFFFHRHLKVLRNVVVKIFYECHNKMVVNLLSVPSCVTCSFFSVFFCQNKIFEIIFIHLYIPIGKFQKMFKFKPNPKVNRKISLQHSPN